ncbi:MAG: hypothetical protein JWP47_2157 [Polaromonas sp.]|jgi:general secretion pathway protein L|nr:hypothetical protein [Polaromonas sp.]
MSTFIICLPTTESSAAVNYDYALTGDGLHLADHASAPLVLLPAVQRGTELVAVVPVDALSWHRVELPKGIGANSPRLRTVLDNLLEDRLLDDPAQLHLALGPATPGAGSVWVAACNRNWLRSHLQALESAGRPVARIVPEFAPEAGPLQVHLTGEADLPYLIATGEAIQGVLRVPLSAASLALLPVPASDQPVLIAAEPAVAALGEDLLQSKVNLLTRPQRWLDAARSSWDLAQFDMSSSGGARTVKRLSGAGRALLQAPSLQPARWGVAALVLANLVGLNAWAWKEQSALQARRLAIRDTLTRTFPQIRVVVDAPLQMDREVTALRQATGAASPRDLEAMLAALGAAVPAGQTVSAIDYSAGEARVKGLQLAGPDASNLSSQLAVQGYGFRTDGDTTTLRPTDAKEGAP